eukprot:Skav209563  [mRNA]  locus=scaffold2497:760320:761849:+ [translate_table: standard]
MSSLCATARHATWPRHRALPRPLLYPVLGVASPCYGLWHAGRRTQGFLAVGSLDDELLEYLRQETWMKLSLAEPQLWGFETSAKEPFLSKADWHTFPQPQITALVPRLGKPGRLRRAPIRCVAFAEALRKRLVPRGWPPGELLDAAGSFGVVEAQVQVLTEDWQFMRSHHDGASGLLQVGLTLEGSRHLRLGCHAEPRGGDFPENVWDDDAWSQGELVTVPMTAGQVYLATPSILEHGVAYEPRQGPTVALMFRMALPDSAQAQKVNRCQSDDFHVLAGWVASELQDALDSGSLHLPSLADVKQAELELENIFGYLREKLKIMAHALPSKEDESSPPRIGWERPPELMGYVSVEDFKRLGGSGSGHGEQLDPWLVSRVGGAGGSRVGGQVGQLKGDDYDSVALLGVTMTELWFWWFDLKGK